MKIRQLFSRKLFLRYFLSYILIFLIPFIVIFATTYSKTINLAKNNSDNYYENKLSLMQSKFDTLVSDMGNIKDKVEYSEWLKEVFFTKVAENASLNGILISEILQEMKYLSISNSNIESICVKLDEDGTVYTNTGIFKDYTRIGISGASQEDILGLTIQGETEPGFSIIKDVVTSSGTNDYIKYSARITNLSSIGATNRPKGNLVILIGISEIIGEMEKLSADENLIFYIKDPQNENLVLTNNENSESEQINIRGYIRKDYYSEYSDLQYHLFIPEKTYMNNIAYINNSFALSSSLAFFICIAFALFLARMNFNPINLIIEKLNENNKHSVKNSLAFINDRITSILQENDLLEKELEIHKPYMQQHLLKCLVEPENVEDINLDSLRDYDITFEFPTYAVVIAETSVANIHISDTDNNFIFMVAFKKIISTHLSIYKIKGYILEISMNQLAILINVDNKSNFSHFIKALSSGSVFQDKDDISYYPTFAVGGFHEDYIHFNQSYIEAMEALKYKLLEGVGSVIFYDDIKTSLTGNYYYPISDEISLITSIKEGNLKKSINILEQIYNKNILKRNLSVYSARSVYYELVGTIIKTAEQLGFKSETFIDYRQLDSLETLSDILKYLKSVLASINQKVLDSNRTEGKDDNIIHYVEKNCFDPNLTQYIVSENFGLSTSYISLVFKKRFGTSYLEFVNKKRIEKALLLLKNGGYSLSEIYHEIGYDSANTFRRNFIKYTGCKPTEYLKSVM